MAWLTRTVSLLTCLVILLPGCAQLTISGPEAARLTSSVVARLGDEPLFAAAPGGKQVAFFNDGVRVALIPSGESRLISVERPLAMAWSPDGVKLAAVFGRGAESRITVFGADGIIVAETAAAGRVETLFWSSSDSLMAVAVELEPHKFGTTCREVLLNWRLAGASERTVLNDVTLKPYTVRKWGTSQLSRAMFASLSPPGDELVYGRIQDPPAFDAYLKVMVRNLSSGIEREMLKTGFADGVPRFSSDGEELFAFNGFSSILRIDAWSGAEKQAIPFSGRTLAVSPDGRHLLADGRLLDGGREVALFPPWISGAFLSDGRLLVADKNTLFLVSGFEAPATAPLLTAEKQERLRTLRAWRASGLIPADDYNSTREKVMK